MKGPQLIAHLAQIHTWFEAYRIDIDEDKEKADSAQRNRLFLHIQLRET